MGMPLLPLLRFRKLRGVVGVEDNCMELESGGRIAGKG